VKQNCPPTLLLTPNPSQENLQIKWMKALLDLNKNATRKVFNVEQVGVYAYKELTVVHKGIYAPKEVTVEKVDKVVELKVGQEEEDRNLQKI
jgi:hypothetical protein